MGGYGGGVGVGPNDMPVGWRSWAGARGNKLYFKLYDHDTVLR